MINRWAVLGIGAFSVLFLACGKDDESTSQSEIEFIDLGSQEISDTGGYALAAVELPAETNSVMVHCGGVGDDALGAVWTLEDPGGTRHYDGDVGETTKWRSDFVDDLVPALLPLSPKLDVSEGTWNFNYFFGAGNGGSIDCGAVVRTGEVLDTADINVELVFVGLDDLDATSGPDDADWQAVLEQFESEWATAGLAPIFNYTDFTGDVAKFAVVDVADDDYSEFNDLLRTSSPGEERSITFFIVQEIANADGDTILGLSAGPPGAAAVHGTSKSGVIVSGIDFRDAPGDVAKIMAHEGGHFLGLYHTTEKDGSQNDPLDDTPTCPPDNDANGNGTMNSSECAGKGAENVMWWTLTSGSASFSDDQGWVLRRNPAVQ